MTTPKELRPLEEFLARHTESIRKRVWGKVLDLLEQPDQMWRRWLADRPDIPDGKRLDEIVGQLADEIGPLPSKTLRGPATVVMGNVVEPKENVVELKEWVRRKLSVVPEPPEADSPTTWLKPWRFQPLASWNEVQRDQGQRIVLIVAEPVGAILNEDELGLLPPRVLESLKSPGTKLRLPLNYLRELVARSMTVAYTVDAAGIQVTSASRGVADFIPDVTHPILGKPIWLLSNLVEPRFLSKEHRAQFVKTQNDLVKLAEQGQAVFPDVVVFLRNENVRRDEWRGVCRVDVHAEPVYGEKGELVERLITVRLEREGRTEAELKAIDIYKAFRENALASTRDPGNGILEPDMPSLAYTQPIATEQDAAEQEALAAIAGEFEKLSREDPLVEQFSRLSRKTRLKVLASLVPELEEDEVLQHAVQVALRVNDILGRRPGFSEKNPIGAAMARIRGMKGGKARAEKMSPQERSEQARKAITVRWAKRDGKENQK